MCACSWISSVLWNPRVPQLATSHKRDKCLTHHVCWYRFSNVCGVLRYAVARTDALGNSSSEDMFAFCKSSQLPHSMSPALVLASSGEPPSVQVYRARPRNGVPRGSFVPNTVRVLTRVACMRKSRFKHVCIESLGHDPAEEGATALSLCVSRTLQSFPFMRFKTLCCVLSHCKPFCRPFPFLLSWNCESHMSFAWP